MRDIGASHGPSSGQEDVTDMEEGPTVTTAQTSYERSTPGHGRRGKNETKIVVSVSRWIRRPRYDS